MGALTKERDLGGVEAPDGMKLSQGPMLMVSAQCCCPTSRGARRKAGTAVEPGEAGTSSGSLGAAAEGVQAPNGEAAPNLVVCKWHAESRPFGLPGSRGPPAAQTGGPRLLASALLSESARWPGSSQMLLLVDGGLNLMLPLREGRGVSEASEAVVEAEAVQAGRPPLPHEEDVPLHSSLGGVQGRDSSSAGTSTVWSRQPAASRAPANRGLQGPCNAAGCSSRGVGGSAAAEAPPAARASSSASSATPPSTSSQSPPASSRRRSCSSRKVK
mmetsp:Transcript_101350/g.321932  ORF Transcript_101350/g.321932 Transcript_101350/m.321932 type:complete len:272 (-) Transcript_101350:37-852(-)